MAARLISKSAHTGVSIRGRISVSLTSGIFRVVGYPGYLSNLLARSVWIHTLHKLPLFKLQVSHTRLMVVFQKRSRTVKS